MVLRRRQQQQQQRKETHGSPADLNNTPSAQRTTSKMARTISTASPHKGDSSASSSRLPPHHQDSVSRLLQNPTSRSYQMDSFLDEQEPPLRQTTRERSEGRRGTSTLVGSSAAMPMGMMRATIRRRQRRYELSMVLQLFLPFSAILFRTCHGWIPFQFSNVWRTATTIYKRDQRGIVSSRFSSSSFLESPPSLLSIRIRNCQHGELGACADIIMSSFYNSTLQNPWRSMYRLGELNRLQQGFPYGDTRAEHQMLVAVVDVSSPCATGNENKQDKIIGFVDVDARIPNRRTSYTYNPRPYLSDLCVHPEYRRQGVARALIQACEAFSVQLQQQGHFLGKDDEPAEQHKELYIRVQANNAAAVAMYDSMGYESIHNPDDPKGESILILHKNLTSSLRHRPRLETGGGKCDDRDNDSIGLAAGRDSEKHVVLMSSSTIVDNDI